MRLVIATSADDTLGGVFARAYYEAGGPPPVAVFVMEGRPDLSHPAWSLPWVALRMFGPVGVARIGASRKLKRPITKRDRESGLHLDWLDALSRDATRVNCRNLHDADALTALRELSADVLVSIGAPRVIKPVALEVPRLGALNVHNGMLPKYRGHFGSFWEILNGEGTAGITIHEMTPTVDSGGIVAREEVAVASVSTFLDLLLEKKRRGGRLLATVLRDLAARPRPISTLAMESVHPAATPGYFAWPRLADIARFAFPAGRTSP